jgi:hypothetical protein
MKKPLNLKEYWLEEVQNILSMLSGMIVVTAVFNQKIVFPE